MLSEYLSGYFITIWLNQIILSKCANFPYFVIGSGAARLCHGPFSLMDLVNPVLPGEGRWLTGDASARALEDLTRSLHSTFQLSEKFFFWAGRLHALILVAVFSLADVLFIWKSRYC